MSTQPTKQKQTYCCSTCNKPYKSAKTLAKHEVKCIQEEQSSVPTQDQQSTQILTPEQQSNTSEDNDKYNKPPPVECLVASLNYLPPDLRERVLKYWYDILTRYLSTYFVVEDIMTKKINSLQPTEEELDRLMAARKMFD